MKKFLLFVIMTFTVLGQTKLSINPGVKLGIAFGEKTQFIFGTELSFVFYHLGNDNGERVGITLNYDRVDDVKRFHFGFEYMYKAVGIDIGPTLAWKESKMHYGFSVIPFGGFILLPYFNYTNIEGIDDQFDFGSYLKIPIPLTKKRFSFGG